ncbi:MAG: hypothetical protein LBL26_01370, partial [Peptococcaceae bacterium]|nr:hypothetical protein [Peptococcaceae bacterium]
MADRVLCLTLVFALALSLFTGPFFAGAGDDPDTVPPYYGQYDAGGATVYIYESLVATPTQFRVYTDPLSGNAPDFYASDEDGNLYDPPEAVDPAADQANAKFTPAAPDPDALPPYYGDGEDNGGGVTVYPYARTSDVFYRVYGALGGGGDAFYPADEDGVIPLSGPLADLLLDPDEERAGAAFQYLDPAPEDIPEYYAGAGAVPGLPGPPAMLYSYRQGDGAGGFNLLYRVYGAYKDGTAGFYDANGLGALTDPIPAGPLDQDDESNNAYNSGVASSVEDELRPNEAYISGFALDDVKDGTPVFDADDTPGNDSGPSNNIVRSFDSVSYTLKYFTRLQNQADPTYFRRGWLYVKFVLPGVAPSQANFDLTGMRWLEEGDYALDYSNGDVTLTGRHLIRADGGMTAIPGSGTLSVAVKALGMANGAAIAPSFECWLEGYDEAAPVDSNVPRLVIPDPVTVSASPNQVNIWLERSLHVDYVGDWDFSTGNSDAPNKDAGFLEDMNIYGYGIQLQVMNKDGTVKKLKGVELPQGPITFDIELKAFRRGVDSGDPGDDVTGTGPDQVLPLLWDYQPHIGRRTGNSGRNMEFASDSHAPAAPYNAPVNNIPGAYCVDGGTWTMTQSGNIISVTVDAYKFLTAAGEYRWPLRNRTASLSAPPRYGEDMGIGVFSVGYAQIVFPIPKPADEAANYSIQVTGQNLRTQTLSQMQLTGNAQPETGDDADLTNVVIPVEGIYDKFTFLTVADHKGSTGGKNLSSSSNELGPDAWAPAGSRIEIQAVPRVDPRTPASRQPYAIDMLQKFDAEAFQPEDGADGTPTNETPMFSGITMKFKLIYVAKADGSNWAGDEEMERAEMATNATSDGITASHKDIPNPTLRYYATMADLCADRDGLALGVDTRKCVAVLVQGRGGHFGTGHIFVGFNVNILPTAEVGKVYQTTNDLYMWFKDKGQVMTHDDGTRLNGTQMDVLDAPDMKADIRNTRYSPYVKTEYDGNGDIVKLTHGPLGYRSGASLLIVGVEATITTSVDQRAANGTDAKASYSMGYGERRVDYVLTPSVLLAGKPEETAADADRSTVIIRAILPDKVTLQPGTRYYMGGDYVPDPNHPYGGALDTAGATEIFLAEPPAPLPEGGTELKWVIPNVVPGPDALRPIHFSAWIGSKGGNESEDEVYDTEQLVTQATIQATGDGRALRAEFGNIAANAVGIVKLEVDSLQKSLEESLVEVGEDVVFNVVHQNTGENDYDGYELLDILPYNGDVRGSVFDGTYTARLEISFPLGGSGTEISVYELAGNAADWDSKDVRDIDTASQTFPSVPSATISNASLNEAKTLTLNSATRAVFIRGKLSAHESYKMRVVLTPVNNTGGNLYSNDVTAVASESASGSGSGEQMLLAPQVTAVVVYRAISGLAWLDADRDGLRQAGEPVLSGVRAALYNNSDQQPATDVRGEAVAPVLTDLNGRYEFTDLAEGSYFVRFGASPTFAVGDYGVTEKDAGSNAFDSSDSDVTGFTAVSGGLRLLTRADTDALALPAKTSVSPYGYHLRNVDAGFTLGALKIIKTDGAGAPLAGAVFTLTRTSGAGGPVIPVGATDAGGEAVASGLKMGRYTLTETQAPTGYAVEKGTDGQYTVDIVPDLVGAAEIIEYPVTNRPQPAVGIDKEVNYTGKAPHPTVPGAYGPVSAGTPARYTVTVTNNAAANARLKDIIITDGWLVGYGGSGSGVSGLSARYVPASGSARDMTASADYTFSETLGEIRMASAFRLNKDDQIIVTYNVNLTAIGENTNTARVEAVDEITEDSLPPEDDTVTVIVVDPPEIEIVKDVQYAGKASHPTVSGAYGPAVTGTRAEYTLTVKNNTGAANARLKGIIITDGWLVSYGGSGSSVSGLSVRYVPASGSARDMTAGTDYTFSETLGEIRTASAFRLNPNDQIIITYNVNLTAIGENTNTARVEATDEITEEPLDPDDDTVTVIVVDIPEVDVDKSAPATGRPGDPVPYVIRVSNTGAEPLKNIVVTDTRLGDILDGTLRISRVPGGGANAAVPLSPADYSLNRQQGKIETAGHFRLPVGDALIIEYALSFETAGSYRNDARAEAVGEYSGKPTDPAEDDTTVVIEPSPTPTPAPDIGIDKEVDYIGRTLHPSISGAYGPVSAGTQARYTVTVRNDSGGADT